MLSSTSNEVKPIFDEERVHIITKIMNSNYLGHMHFFQLSDRSRLLRFTDISLRALARMRAPLCALPLACFCALALVEGEGGEIYRERLARGDKGG